MHKSRVDTEAFIGQKFGSLTVTKFIKEEFQESTARFNFFYLCTCDCGNTELRTRIGLLQGRQKTKNISCKTCRINNLKTNPLGIKYDNDLDRNIGIVFSNYKSKARTKKWDFDLTQPEFKILVTTNCYYCGLEPNNFREGAAKRAGISTMHLSGVDRIDSSKGYTKENVRSCCQDCNLAKRSLTEKQFFDLIKRIYNHRIK